ncbi:MAG: hypothetical protein ACOY37_01575 [Pseudomonadota bacterium]
MTRSRLALATLAAALAVAPAARADQFVYLDLQQARAALARLRAGDVVHHYCAPCGDAKSERMTVRSLGIDRVWDRDGSAQPYNSEGLTFWVVELNEVSVDLAYVYVREGGQWRNLADLLGLQPWRVPAVLPRERTGARWRCGTPRDPDPGNPYFPQLDARRDPCPLDAPGPAIPPAGDPGWR